MQLGENDCGPAALWTLAAELSLHTFPLPYSYQLPEDRQGVSMATLVDLAARHGLKLRGVFDRTKKARFSTPWIAHLNSRAGHFVVVERVERTSWTVADPGVGRVRMTTPTIKNLWSGNALLVVKDGSE